MESWELEMLSDLFTRISWDKGLWLCAVLLALQAVKTHWRRRRHKRIYRDFQRELVLCRQRLEHIQKSMETQRIRSERRAPLIPHFLIALWRKLGCL